MSASSQRNVKWVEGLRGITSILVITTHMARAWDFQLFWPRDSIDTPAARLLQWPIIRVPFQGRVGVPIFAFLTGFVCAYKPLKLAYQQGNHPAALKSLARSAFRRPPRLVLPAIVMTVIGFLLTCMGAFKVSAYCDSFWVRFDAPNPATLPLGEEIRRLLTTLLTTWTNGENIYDRHQWAMRPLLVGAFQVYITLAATIGMRFRYRIVVHVLLLTYWLVNTSPMTETFGANLSLGTLLAELSLHRPTQSWLAARSRVLTYVVAPALIISGLYIGSYPHEHEDWAPWTAQLRDWFVDPAGDLSRGTLLVPLGSDPPRRFSGAMVRMLATAIFVSPPLREALSHRWLLWLGKHSFAVYLVHGTMLRTVGMWIVYGVSTAAYLPGGKNDDGSEREPEYLHMISRRQKKVAIVVFVSLTYLAAWAWMKWVDSACARATAWLEEKVFDDEDEAGGGKQGLAEKGFARPEPLITINGHTNGILSPGGLDKPRAPPP